MTAKPGGMRGSAGLGVPKIFVILDVLKILMKKLLCILAWITLQNAQAQLVADFSATSTVLDCNTSCVDFTDLTTGGTPISWQWSFPGGVPATSSARDPLNICYANDGVYDVTLIVSDGFDIDTLVQPAYIFKQAVPGAFVAFSDTSIPFGMTIQLGAGGGTSYSWQPTAGMLTPTAPDPFVFASNTTVYSVTVSDGSCSSILTVNVNVEKDNNLFVPTAFSPNGDGYNEILYLRGNNLSQVRFSVYDRWGVRVFESTNPGRGWDGNYNGEKAAAGSYTYVAVIVFTDGGSQTLSGQTSLVR